MNITKFTQKSLESIQNCQGMATEYGNPQVEQEHLLYCLLTVDDSLIAKLIEKMGIDAQSFTTCCKNAVEVLPRVSGASSQTYVSNSLNKVCLLYTSDAADE